MGFLLACLSGDLNKVKYYSELVDIDDRDFYGNSGLALACKKGHLRISEFLLGKSLNPDSKNHTRQTPLHLACLFGNIECVKALLKNGADVNLQDKSGNTPLIVAAKANFPEIIQLLIEYGADPRVEDMYGKAPIERCKDLRVISMLQTCKNKKKREKRSKSALVFDRLFYKFDQDAWDRSKLGIRVSSKVREKINEVKNSLTAKLEAFMKREIEENDNKASQEIKNAIEKWTFLYSMKFEQNLKNQVENLAMRKPPKIDLYELFLRADEKAQKKLAKKIKRRIEKNLKAKIKKEIQEAFWVGKNHFLSDLSGEIRKKFSNLF